MKKLIAIALLLAPATAFAAGEPAAAPRTFKRDGLTFTYTAVQKNGATEIQGTDSEGRAFALVVKDKRVTGEYADAAVEFRKPAKRSALAQSAD